MTPDELKGRLIARLGNLEQSGISLATERLKLKQRLREITGELQATHGAVSELRATLAMIDSNPGGPA